MSVIISVQQVVTMFILMLVGYLCSQLKFIHEQTAKDMTNLLLYIVSPCLIVNAFLQKFSWKRLEIFGMIFLVVLASMLVMIVLSKVIFARRIIKAPAKRAVLLYSATYSNAGFMGIPLAQAIIGNNGVFFAVPYLVVYNLFMWTHGKGLFQLKNRESLGLRLRDAIINPNIIATAVGLLLFILQIKLPSIVKSPITYITDLNTPLSMLVIGTNLGALNLHNAWKDKLAWSAVLVRNLIFPIIVMLLLFNVSLGQEATLTTLILISCPVAGTIVLFSLLSNFDIEFPTKIMCLSTLVSIVTVPLMILLASILGI
ncbi:AEC family transporter [Ligilactobacillus sp. WILCCON 0076]|uniref:AEC family transporter n=1 Tax=Ligilactobacillus ubinensis TaxID=2876789 RepID=A0A9X2JM72_9LACO|nr:AEC family transporter [Ligilactobacillus ubinensis]MCP0887787.1 AEC family transporter [Ligilactobacillus ubinensis]